MRDIERQTRIVELFRAGAGISDIANQIQLSPERVSQIIRKDTEDKEQEDKCSEFLDKIRASGDINQTWDLECWLDCLFLSKRARRSLSDHYRQSNIAQIAIIDFMDMIIDVRATDLDGPDTAHPIRNLKDVGYTTFREILEKLTWIDLGDPLNQEWDKRLMVYKRHDFIFQRLFGHIVKAED